MMASTFLEAFDSNAVSFAEAKRIRQQIQRDAKLLENRIKLLTKEEAKTIKRIEDTQKHTLKVNEAYERHAEKIKAQADYRQIQTQRIQEAQNTIHKLKEQRQLDRQRRYNSVMRGKQQAAQVVREIKADAVHNKLHSHNALETDVMLKTAAVKQDLAHASEHVKAFHEQRLKEARELHAFKFEEEERIRLETQQRILGMETLETELIARLQNTQQLQYKAYSELEKALARKQPRRMSDIPFYK